MTPSSPPAPSMGGGGVAASAAAPSIGREMAKGAAWMVLMRLVIRLIGLVGTIVLARLLVPDDFGLVALSTSIIFAVEMLGHFSFDIALIRDTKADRAEYDTAWTLSVIRGWVTAFLVAVFAVPMGELFNEPRLALVLYGLAIATVIEGYQNIGIVDLRKHMQFRREFNFLVSQRVINFIVTVVLAVWLQQYWALVVGIVVGRVSGTVLSYVMSAYRPRHSLQRWRPLLNFSKWLLMNNILSLLGRADVYVIGRYFGAHDLGIYNVSVEISSLPSTELVAPIQRAIYPGFAKLADNVEHLKKSYLDGLAILSMLAVPASTGIAVLADPLVRVLLGGSWLAVIPLLQIFSLHGLIKLAGGNAHSALLALGRPRILTVLTLMNLAILGPTLVAGIYLGGLTGAAWAMVATAGLTVLLSYSVVLKRLHITVGELFSVVWRKWSAAAIMGVVVFWVAASDAAWFQHPLARLVTGVLAGIVVYVVALLALWVAAGRPHSAERMTLDALNQFRSRMAAGKTKPAAP